MMQKATDEGEPSRLKKRVDHRQNQDRLNHHCNQSRLSFKKASKQVETLEPCRPKRASVVMRQTTIADLSEDLEADALQLWESGIKVLKFSRRGREKRRKFKLVGCNLTRRSRFRRHFDRNFEQRKAVSLAQCFDIKRGVDTPEFQQIMTRKAHYMQEIAPVAMTIFYTRKGRQTSLNIAFVNNRQQYDDLFATLTKRIKLFRGYVTLREIDKDNGGDLKAYLCFRQLSILPILISQPAPFPEIAFKVCLQSSSRQELAVS